MNLLHCTTIYTCLFEILFVNIPLIVDDDIADNIPHIVDDDIAGPS